MLCFIIYEIKEEKEEEEEEEEDEEEEGAREGEEEGFKVGNSPKPHGNPLSVAHLKYEPNTCFSVEARPKQFSVMPG